MTSAAKCLLMLLLLAGTTAARGGFPGEGLINDQPPFLAGVKVDHFDLSYRQGDTLAVDFHAERDAHLYLVYHQADGKSYLLFPNEAATDNRVPARQHVRIPPNDDDFRFRIAPPFGTEVLQVLASLRPIEALDRLVQRTGRAARVPDDLWGPLADQLKRDRSWWTEHRVPIRTSGSVDAGSRPGGGRAGVFIGVSLSEMHAADGEGRNVAFRTGAEVLAEAMAQRGRIPSERAKLLVAKSATKANIESAITQWLPSVSQPGDTVFIFYAGHGGLIKNLDGTKPDGKDGVLSTYDDGFKKQKLSQEEYEAALRRYYISDNTLGRWLQELPGRQVVVLVFSCYSGSMIDAKLLTTFATREAQRVKAISGVNIVVLATSLPDEESIYHVKKPIWLGYHLAEAMRKYPPPVTLRQGFEYYRQQQRQYLEGIGQVGFHEPVLVDTALLPVMLVP